MLRQNMVCVRGASCRNSVTEHLSSSTDLGGLVYNRISLDGRGSEVYVIKSFVADDDVHMLDGVVQNND